jgi:hypothetical protein
LYFQEKLLPVKKPGTRLLLPVWGIIIFCILYIISAALYPGGNDSDKTTIGFSWQHNYWCELISSQAQNGQSNTARPVAITALLVLTISLVIFWYQVPQLFHTRNAGSLIIRYCGISSMLVMPLLLTGIHDTVINLAGGLGCIAIALLLVKLYNHRMYFLFWQGIAGLLICAANNYIYYTKGLLHYLPVIQKISFVFFLLWFVQLCIKQKRRGSLC